MFSWLKQLLSQRGEEASGHLRRVPGALVFRGKDGNVIYNLLTPHMQQFMGRCVGAIKKAGIPARGTAQFSILVGAKGTELVLDPYYRPEDDPAALDVVVKAAKKLV